jgi:phosphonate transport system permease protein
MRPPEEVRASLARRNMLSLVGLGAILALTALSAIVTEFDFREGLSSFPKAFGWMVDNLAPNAKALKIAGKVGMKLLETVLVSVMASVFAAAFAFFLAILASRTTRPHPAVSAVVRAFASLCRNIPVVAWAMIFLLSFGQNVLTGLLALFIGTLGYLTRAFTEVVDETAKSSVEALTAAGATWLQIVFQSVLPSALPQVVSWVLYMVETNIRDATLVGILTGTGIGFLFDLYYKSMQFDKAGLVVLGIILLVVAIETMSNALRRIIL